MTLPPSIANLGAPRNATPELMAQLRAEKSRQAALIEAREINRLQTLADYIEANPQEAITQATGYVHKFLASPGHVRLHWALRQWKTILETWSAAEIANLLRENRDATRELRETSPFARPIGARV